MAKKTACDLLIRNAHVLTCDRKDTAYADGAIAISGRNILAVGPAKAIEAKYQSSRSIDARGGLVHPGFIDMHYHLTFHLVGKMIDEVDFGGADPGPWVAAQYTRLINAIEMLRNKRDSNPPKKHGNVPL